MDRSVFLCYLDQKLNVYKTVSDFLPSLNYEFQAVNNIELPVLVFMGNRFRIGTKYNFNHVLQVQLPLFLGGARIANFNMQRHAHKSFLHMLRGKKQDVALKAIEAYYNVMLARDLIKVNEKARAAAQANFEQVKKFYQAGSASQLDLLRAKARLSQTLPALTSAKNALTLGLENLKFLLNLSSEDSVVVLDSLCIKEFLGSFKNQSLEELQALALANRWDLQSMEQQHAIQQNQKWLTGSRFLPNVIVSAKVQHQAFLENTRITAHDYTRSKSAAIALQWPLFEGGKRLLEFQQAFIQTEKVAFQKEQLKQAIRMEVKNSWQKFQEAKQNLQSLQAAFKEAQEALRLADLTYQEGVSTQVDVLNAQTAFTNSEVQYRKGIFDYNVSQLRLLKAIGKLDVLWQDQLEK